MPQDKTVDICIVTFKGQKLIGQLLSSIADLDLSRIRLRVIVVDNDSARSSWPAVQVFSDRSEFELEYVVEPMRGIPYARNKALDCVRSEYFAFVDDDEQVDSQWLQIMLGALNDYQADFVFGPVPSILPTNTPDWARSHRAFLPVQKPTGTPLTFGATGNIVGRIQSVVSSGVRFDPSFSETGAEDTDFFHRLYLRGCKLVWCNEGIITEEVRPERVNVSWIQKRAFRSGQSFYRIVLRRYPLWKRITWLMIVAVRAGFESLGLAVTRPVSFSTYTKILHLWSIHIGQLSMVFGDKYVYHEYSSTNYRTDH